MGAGSYVRYSSHSSYVSTAHVTATFTYLRVVVRTVGNAGTTAILNGCLFYSAREESMLKEEPFGLMSYAGILYKSDINLALMNEIVSAVHDPGRARETGKKMYNMDEVTWFYDKLVGRITFRGQLAMQKLNANIFGIGKRNTCKGSEPSRPPIPLIYYVTLKKRLKTSAPPTLNAPYQRSVHAVVASPNPSYKRNSHPIAAIVCSQNLSRQSHCRRQLSKIHERKVKRREALGQAFGGVPNRSKSARQTFLPRAWHGVYRLFGLHTSASDPKVYSLVTPPILHSLSVPRASCSIPLTIIYFNTSEELQPQTQTRAVVFPEPSHSLYSCILEAILSHGSTLDLAVLLNQVWPSHYSTVSRHIGLSPPHIPARFLDNLGFSLCFNHTDFHSVLTLMLPFLLPPPYSTAPYFTNTKYVIHLGKHSVL
ncbi:uncharacterized protein BDR25DRAFT_352040 [Lindgomyces ingoldianus]|uniref:Uncharacterized protein n=1 Tax=Lindgomyces ingoldianus TaxID=673940 RepID=A0ACB6R2R5_9PLEO|nr:uncharacterized protein BDR25DRAFT_352040 [Lindgomyces ingoldianus]KAF2473544.1 hypothetical protein BDR25DRAFT_352040 [Lindgomyces ingoldianus]